MKPPSAGSAGRPRVGIRGLEYVDRNHGSSRFRGFGERGVVRETKILSEPVNDRPCFFVGTHFCVSRFCLPRDANPSTGRDRRVNIPTAWRPAALAVRRRFSLRLLNNRGIVIECIGKRVTRGGVVRMNSHVSVLICKEGDSYVSVCPVTSVSSYGGH